MAGKSTLRQVAERAGVAIGTASAVFAEKEWVSDRVRVAVQSAADELEYTPRARRPAARENQVLSLGFLSAGDQVFSPGNPYFTRVLHGAQQACAELDISLQYEVVDPTTGRLPLCVERGQVSGLLVLSYEIDRDYLRRLLDRKIACTLLEHGPMTGLRVDHVRHDDETGGALAARHLLSLDRTPRMPAIITSFPHISPGEDRLTGFRRALAEEGVPFDERYLRRGWFDVASGLRCMLELLDLDEPPTAVFGANDDTALGAIEAARARGLRVPEDLAVMGYDDIPNAARAMPPLTTVSTDKELIGAQAVWNLVERLRRPDLSSRDTRLAVRLVERASTAVAATVR